MRIVIQKSELLRALQQVARAIPSRTPKPILYGVKLTVSGEELTVTAYDLEIGVETRIYNSAEEGGDVLQIDQPGSIVLQGRSFIDIVRRLPHQLVRIDVSGLVATVYSGSATFTLNGMDAREYPALPAVSDDRGFAISSDTLKALIEHTAYAVATSEARPTLTGVLWRYDNGQLTLLATDSHRLATEAKQVDAMREYAMMDSIIPGKSLMELSRILPDTDLLVDILIANNQLMAAFGRVKFYSRMIEGNYPDVSRIIPSNWRTTVTVHVKSFLDCIERAALLARDNDNQVVRMQLRQTHIEVSSHSPEIGKITETIEPKSFEGDEMLLACNSKFLLDALKAIVQEDVKVHFTGSGSPFILKPVGNDDFLQLILPVRVANV